MDPFLLVVIVIALALFFDFTNGFHDTANAMATPVATGAIKPKTAVTLAAVLNLVGAFLSTEVAMTVSKGIINESSSDGGILITPSVILAGLMGAIVWNLLTWLLGLPSSSSHALFGGLIGAAIVGAGFSAVNYGTLLEKVLIPAVAAPLIAGMTAFCATKLAYRVTRRNSNQISPKRGGFKIGQIFSSSLVALAHGTNDAQKTMGIITLVLVSANMQEAGTGPHFWVIASCAFAIALGTYTGGWRIMRTMGTGLTEVKPPQGFAAEVSTGAAILASSHLGFALSTTQVASGSVVGSGLGRKGAGVRWRTAGKIATGWLFTLPAAAIIGGIAAALTHIGPVGVWIVLITGLASMLVIFLISMRNSVTHENAMRGVEVSSAAVHIPTKKERRSAARALRREAREAHEHAKAAAAKAKSEARKARRAARAATHASRVARKAAAAELREARRAQDIEEAARLSFIAAVDSQAAAEESDVAAREAERAAKEARRAHDRVDSKQRK
ncbi:anion permease [Pseudoglutamicibacter albus]|uniref:Phosphate transporter n=1 Tax=Pseudoglutamicibacter cumminsii TaxID=156979 RepID=A0AAP4C736_9MICC|nr:MULTISPECIES: inorganic phosphate transporter [Pseudoglutamicibacter]MCT1685912.1 inorganic phosphate transporter [Pseudoglutamicibacter cumminsii]MDK6275523.1 anion permease [Pseudoglutamicibacter cumminsii]PKY80515.1 phosphate transporter [Pseudoglutamicibacter albus]WIK84576.1 anion permease [Pseudoglutamicibacter albus]